ncbi:DUF202 domain-containing protein [Vibrio splendidus]|uniref:DUF202 domain-containing protein n=1 Tax=Vibrio splendidus TaxID=29497 RepID=UPI000C849EDC|nr:hypothetical protein BCT08_13305 [Vibrio splendidus]
MNSHDFSSRTRDAGVQPERTSLSWRRTLVVMIIHTLLLTKSSIIYQQYWLLPIVLMVLLITWYAYRQSAKAEQSYWFKPERQFLSNVKLKLVIVVGVISMAISYCISMSARLFIL